ncbi:growth/differentiation factor 10 isoform 1-T2 [Menidia menidia]
MISSHLFLLMLNSVLTTASVSSFQQVSPKPFTSDLDEDMVSQHMFRLYEKYNKENRLKEGNTVRSFRANRDSTDHRMMYQLNLTTLQDTEVILSATFHFLFETNPHPKPWFCKGFKSPSCRSAAIHPSPPIRLILRSVLSGSEGSFLGNVTFHPHRRGVWQMKDVTQVIKEAQDRGQLLVSLQLDLGQQPHKKSEENLPPGSMPYLLLYADDQTLTEPNSVAASLQKYDPFNEGDFLPRQNSSPELIGRVRRETQLSSDPVQNNELPEVDYWLSGYRKDDQLDSNWHLALKPKPKSERNEKKRKTQDDTYEPQMVTEEASQEAHTEDSPAKKLQNSHSAKDRRKNERKEEGKGGKKHKGSAKTRSPVLNFDEQTMRKARRRQWGSSQHRGCSKRNLRVDFADIGWSEWVIAPKAFDAYYCSGTCGFPMPQVLRPSNHATIQSIVRAVGIIPGVPEPCCVPETMSHLAVLFKDESRNPVLKIYPNMSVQSCSCR